MHIIHRIIGAVLSVAAIGSINPTSASATSLSGKISSVVITGTSFVQVNMVNFTSGGRPACHNAFYISTYAFDLSTSKGRAMLSTLQAALLAGKDVTVTGGSTCTNTGSVTLETVQSLTL